MKEKHNKILILGGVSAHIEFVKEAKKFGLYTIVADYLKDSPAKKYCDKAYNIDIKDIDALYEMCINEKVSAIVCAHIDPAQMPYVLLCNKLNIPCYGTKKQFEILTNKNKFKNFCIENNLDVIPGYSEEDVAKKNIKFPVIVKPSDGRASKGQTICHNYDELNIAIDYAKKCSFSNQYIIEEYFDDAQEFSVSYFYVNGKPNFLYFGDAFTGSTTNNLSNVFTMCYVPSIYSKLYFSKYEKKVLKMFDNLGINNGPVFIEGFIKNDVLYFFDPGFRLLGFSSNLLFSNVSKVSLEKLLIYYAINGKMPDVSLPEIKYFKKNYVFGAVFPVLKPGKIKGICNIDKIKKLEYVRYCIIRKKIGDIVYDKNDSSRWLGEITFIVGSYQELLYAIQEIQDLIYVFDENGNDMIQEVINIDNLQLLFNDKQLL